MNSTTSEGVEVSCEVEVDEKEVAPRATEEEKCNSTFSASSSSSPSSSDADSVTGIVVALGCNSESLAYPPTVLLTELPHLVVEEILRHLDVPSRLALRRTSRTTKEMVENSKFLSLFHVVIQSEHDMTSVVEFAKGFPRTKWTNVSFPERGFESYPVFPSFVSLFSGHINKLLVHHFNGGLAQILFLSACENLQVLRIDEMDLRQNPTLVVASDKMLKAKCPKLLDIFTELQGLSIGTISFNEVKQLSFYQTFLQRCRKLVTLNVPRTQGPPTVSWESLKGIQLKNIIGPISEYLHKKPVTSPIKTDIAIVDVDGLFSRHFPVVAEICVRTGSVTLFENVNEKHVKYLFNNEGDILQRIVSLKEKIDDRRPISKWDHLQQLYVRSSRCDVREEYPGYTAFPKLKHLSLVMDSRSRDDPNFAMLQRLVKLLVMTEREHLEQFFLQWPLFAHDTPQDYITASDFIGNFSNLTWLHLSGWTRPDDDFLLICAILGKLKVLILEDCLNLTDFGLLGPANEEQPAILNLTNLSRLEIRNKNNPGFLTDLSFESAFQHMRLKVMLIESFHVTMKGYESLLDGELKWTIEKLPLPHVLPRGVTQDEFALFTASHFPNIVVGKI